MADQRPSLHVEERAEHGSRESRRLRRDGKVPAVLYGASHPDPVSLKVEALDLRRLLAKGAALFDVEIGGERKVPVILKDQQLHPVRADVMHVDFLEVRLDEKIQSTVYMELLGGDDSPGVKAGGVLDQPTRELNIEALPTDIPEVIEVDVSAMEMGETMTLEAVPAINGVDYLDEVEETVIATVILPTVEAEPEIEEETELVGEDGEAAEAGDEESAADSGDSSDS
ncbi:MAG: 50S ribosomal protein L25 [Thermoleophilaceae bacterium]